MRGVPLLEMALGLDVTAGALALVGPMGCGRTVLCLQIADAALKRGQRVGYLTGDTSEVMLQQATSLGLDLRNGLRSERLALMQMAMDVAGLLRIHGARALMIGLETEVPDADLLIIDPLTSLLAGSPDEEMVRAAIQTIFAGYGEGRPQVIATAQSERLEGQPALELALADLCTGLLSLEREPGGARQLRLLKSRFGGGSEQAVPFVIGRGGTQIADAPVIAESESEREFEPESPAASSPAPRKRVLIVDPHEEDRKQLVGYLADTYEIVEASDGFSALSSVLEESPDLIVLDPAVPDAPGLGLLAAFHKMPIQVPILAVSRQMARAADRIRALVLGATDVLPKQPTRVELRMKVDTLIELPRRSRTRSDQEDLDVVMLTASQTRAVDEEQFRERMRRAFEFGRRYDLPSSVGWVCAEPAAAMDALLDAAQATLRAEDAVYAVDDSRAILLLVAAAPEHADRALKRIEELIVQKCQDWEPDLERSCVEISAEILTDTWWEQMKTGSDS